MTLFKKIVGKLIIAAAILLVFPTTNAVAYDFSVDGLNYTITDSQKLECELSGPARYKGTLVIPETVTYMGKTMTVVGVGKNAFYIKYGTSGGANLKEVIMPNSIRYLAYYCFGSNTALKKVELSNNLTNIGKGVFSGCSTLGTITLPESLEIIDDYAFNACHYLMFHEFPNGLKKIGKRAFCSCAGGGSVSFPSSLRSIGEEAYKDLYKPLTGINFCEGLDSIYANAFRENELLDLAIPESVSYIGVGAFYQSLKLRTLTIKGTPKMDGSCFATCTSIENIYCVSEKSCPQLLGSNCFHSTVYKLANLYVPDNMVETYRNAPIWKDFQFILPLSSSINDAQYDFEDSPARVYSIQGQLILEDILPSQLSTTLSKGLYIIVPSNGKPYKLSI